MRFLGFALLDHVVEEIERQSPDLAPEVSVCGGLLPHAILFGDDSSAEKTVEVIARWRSFDFRHLAKMIEVLCIANHIERLLVRKAFVRYQIRDRMGVRVVKFAAWLDAPVAS